jgi:hypothetical protein
MNQDTCAFASNSARRTKDLEDQQYGGRFDRQNPSEHIGNLTLLDKGWFGCVPKGFMVTTAIFEGRELKGVFVVVPIR